MDGDNISLCLSDIHANGLFNVLMVSKYNPFLLSLEDMPNMVVLLSSMYCLCSGLWQNFCNSLRCLPINPAVT